ncbi:MAG: FAD-dependent thymidylate synthase [Methylophilaceae bacterium]|nr:FAD-dependent thymidylate synthase [Methylophilaceae bacterium]
MQNNEFTNRQKKNLASGLSETQSPETKTTHTLDPLNDGISSLELVRVSGGDIDVVNAARVSFGTSIAQISDRDEKLIRYLVQHDHTSPFEHNQLSFRVKCPLFVARQWMRHRMNSYNEISYRYTQAPVEFYIPSQWRRQDTLNKQSSHGTVSDAHVTDLYRDTVQASFAAYEELLATGVCREQARGLLPSCTYTQFIFTCNLHSLVHFLKLRLHPGAQYEIRVYAQGMLALATPHFPTSMKAWQEKWGL